MANVVIRTLYCIREATGTDMGVNIAIANLPGTLPAATGLGSIDAAVKAVPGLIAAIDGARGDPDDLYLTTSTERGLGNKVWPTDRETMPVGTGQSTAPNLALSFDGSLNVSLWDYDSGSRDDLLGSITVEESELGNELLKKAASDVEGSIYYVHCRVY
ncbi:hypothetical protein PQR75_29895 [Paraburkholderia fungorum]|jgi:hypothetical protein|uniref:hypothetical protein n=1 Tax=Paraburkholderia fungorum TaxID=134537 RepID=UPI0038B97D2A